MINTSLSVRYEQIAPELSQCYLALSRLVLLHNPYKSISSPSFSLHVLEGEIKPLVEQFLHERGLELSPTKTVITHVEKGFDFLGQNVRKYPNGKLLIKPSKKYIKTFLDGIRGNIEISKPRWACLPPI
jgi:RNA-directed DNA polymerase